MTPDDAIRFGRALVAARAAFWLEFARVWGRPLRDAPDVEMRFDHWSRRAARDRVQSAKAMQKGDA